MVARLENTIAPGRRASDFASPGYIFYDNGGSYSSIDDQMMEKSIITRHVCMHVCMSVCLQCTAVWPLIYIYIYIYIYIQCPPLILAPLINMSKGGCENKSALFKLLIFHSINSQNSNLSLK